MDSPVIRPVILCGGSGTRLWPLSRTHYPKQFLRLVDDFSLLQNTMKRLDGLVGLGKPIAVANENHRFLVAEQLQDAFEVRACGGQVTTGQVRHRRQAQDAGFIRQLAQQGRQACQRRRRVALLQLALRLPEGSLELLLHGNAPPR